MPQVPDFESSQQYGFTPLQGASPSGYSAAAEALAQGGQQVAGAITNLDARLVYVRERQAENAAVTHAATVDSNSAIDLAKLQQTALTDPDPDTGAPNPATAADRFRAQATQMKATALAGIDDPSVAALVSRNFDQRIGTSTIGVMGEALKAINGQHLADLQSGNDRYVTALSAAANPADFETSLNTMSALNSAAAQGGIITPEQARLQTSAALRQALTLRGETDPQGAAALLQRYGGVMTGADLVGVTDHLTPKVQRAQADGVLTSIIGGGGSPMPAGGADSTGVPDDVWRAQVQAESGGRQTDASGATLVSSKGAVGRAQLLPETARAVAASIGVDYDENRLRTDPAYNEFLGKQYMGQLLSRYGGDATLALAAYNAGPSRVDQWIAANGDPRSGAVSDADWASRIPIDETRNYVAKVRAGAPLSTNGAPPQPTLSSGEAAPDLQAQLQQAEARTAGMQPEQRAYVFAKIRQNAAEWGAAHAVDVSQLDRDVSNLNLAYQQGLTDQDPPIDRIRAYLPKQADKLIGELQLNRMGGEQIAAMRFAPPDQAQSMLQQWSLPGSVAGDRVAMKDGQLAGTGTIPPDGSAAGAAETPDHLRIRMTILGQLQKAYAQRQDALAKDPAAYVAAAPQLANVQGAGDPTSAAWADASMAMQRQLGAAQPHLLTNAQALSLAQPMLTTDPAKADVGAQVDALAQRFGPNWPQAFGELVSVAKLPAGFQMAANMDAPQQAAARQDFVRVLQLSAQKGGLSQLQDDAPPQAVKDIKSGLDGELDDFRSAYRWNGAGGVNLISGMRNSMEQLATYYAMQGLSGSDALTKAYDGLIGAKYDLGGGPKSTMIAPKGKMPQVEAAAAQVQQSLTAADLRPLGDPGGLRHPDEIAALTEQAARRGFWAPNADASGLTLRMDGRNGSTVPILRADGSPVQVLFKALPPPPPPGAISPTADLAGAG